MSHDVLASLTTSLVATGTCEMPILEAHMSPPPSGTRPVPLPSPRLRNGAPNLSAVLVKLRAISRSATTRDECFAQASKLLSACTLLNGIWWLSPPEDSGVVRGVRFEILGKLADDAADCLWTARQDEFCQLAIRAIADRQLVVCREPLQTLLAIRVPIDRERESALVISMASANDSVQEGMVVAMSMCLEQFLADQLSQKQCSAAAGLSDWYELQQLLNQSQTADEASIVLVNYLKALWGVNQVALLLHCEQGKSLRVAAISDLDQVDATSQACKAMTMAAQALSAEEDIVHWFAAAPDLRHDFEMKQCAEWLRCDGVVIARLKDAQRNVGYLVVGGPARSAELIRLQQQMSALSQHAGGYLRVLRQGHASAWTRLRQSLRRVVYGRSHRVLRYSVLAALAVLCLPWPYRVGTPCKLELVKRRFVAAPFDGLLEKCLVASGDSVKAGQPLAVMDGRQLRLELASKDAELASEQKRRESSLARGDVAQSQIAQQKTTALRAEIELLTRRLSELEISSPLDGIVVSGDLEKIEGAPLKTGDRLFEVGPLDDLIIELEVQDSDIRMVKPGQRVSVALDAFPLRSWNGEIIRIHPRAEIRGDANVFVAEIKLANPDHLLRPGLRGWARIHTGWSPLGWNLFHHPLERAASWLPW